MKLFVVSLYSESGDHYLDYFNANKRPTDEEIILFCSKRCFEEADYLYIREVQEIKNIKNLFENKKK